MYRARSNWALIGWNCSCPAWVRLIGRSLLTACVGVWGGCTCVCVGEGVSLIWFIKFSKAGRGINHSNDTMSSYYLLCFIWRCWLHDVCKHRCVEQRSWIEGDVNVVIVYNSCWDINDTKQICFPKTESKGHVEWRPTEIWMLVRLQNYDKELNESCLQLVLVSYWVMGLHHHGSTKCRYEPPPYPAVIQTPKPHAEVV